MSHNVAPVALRPAVTGDTGDTGEARLAGTGTGLRARLRLASTPLVRRAPSPRAPDERLPARRPSSSRPLPIPTCSPAITATHTKRRSCGGPSTSITLYCTWLPGARERLLQLGLVVDVAGARELDPRVERLDDGLLDLLEAVLEVDGRDRRLEQRGEHVAAARDPVELCSGHVLRLLEQEADEIELLRDPRAAVTRDDVGPDLREPPLGCVGEAVVQRPRDRELEHRVAEELEPLVGGRAVGRPRRVREDVVAPLGGKGFDQARERAPFPRAVAATGARRRSRQPGRRS